MTDNPKRFATGGYARHRGVDLPMFRKGEAVARLTHRRPCIAPPYPRLPPDFSLADLDRIAVDCVKDMARSFMARAALEVAARAVALELVQSFGVSHSLRAVPEVAHTLRGDGFDASEDGTGRGTPLVAVPIQNATRGGDQNGIGIGEEGAPMFTLDTASQHAVAFSCKDYGADLGEVSPTLRSMGHHGSHANAGGQVAVIHRMAVRRLTPRECERLQGFPDDWTLVPTGKRMAADGPRYKQMGNSFAVPVIRWIGRQLELAATS